MEATETHSSLLGIVKDLRDDATTLFRQEIALAKRELAEKALSLGRSAIGIAGGCLLGLYAAGFLLLGLDHLIGAGLLKAGFSPIVAAWFAPILLAMLLTLGGLVLVLKSLKSMRLEKAERLRTVESIREGKDWVKAKVKGMKP